MKSMLWLVSLVVAFAVGASFADRPALAQPAPRAGGGCADQLADRERQLRDLRALATRAAGDLKTARDAERKARQAEKATARSLEVTRARLRRLEDILRADDPPQVL
jgi:hypothetical protein